jgi:hypothetical protein
MRSLKQEAINHYNRLRYWIIEYYNSNDPVNPAILQVDANEDWSGIYCPYCNTYSENCDECKLHTDKGCCNGYWYKMDMAKNWRKWLKWNNKLLKFIRKNG